MTLLDLRNAFGKVHHNLIDCFLEYRHAPEGIRKIVKNLYYCFETSVLTLALLLTSYIWKKVFLQGNCSSPLMFNLIINTFIHSVKHEQYEQFGYKFMS